MNPREMKKTRAEARAPDLGAPGMRAPGTQATGAFDLSSETIDRRFRELSQLHQLGLEIQDARWLGTLEEIAERNASRRTGPDLKPQRAAGT